MRALPCRSVALAPQLRPRAGVTLLELVLVIAIMAALGIASGGLTLLFVRAMLYVPSGAAVVEAGGEAMDAMLEGSLTTMPNYAGETFPGLRAARQIRFANPTIVWFDDEHGAQYQFRWAIEGGLGRLTRWRRRSVWVWDQEYIPYAVDAQDTSTSLDRRTWPDPPTTAVFRYYDINGDPMTNFTWCPVYYCSLPQSQLPNIRRIEVGLVVRSGSGSFDRAEGQVELVSLVMLRNVGH